ncbi:helix-turn-helix domain-containing protein [Halobiforma nitratireducens]|uniref:Bacterio-opsin activator HTH domain protein n=1 Tax=Halobiforma nitratireducens JCM 10879 TaxID=1227454 RepID=M0MKI3_9EURY|nr:helix-turn-helix domain-containing protein [Halobiforma nitratireducens]EMA46197.1 Bacterio-opsin activator HTH domain protein [Halobiforma nitratireducens JCM 10879]
MGVLVEFDAVSRRLVLGPTLETLPSLEVRLERQYAVDPSHPIAFCWVQCGDAGRLERTLDGDGTVDVYQRVGRGPDRSLYRIRRSGSGVVDAYRRWVVAGGELLESRGTEGCWRFEMRFPDRTSFARYHDFLEEEGVELTLHRIADDDPAGSENELLTDSQYEALAVAFESGFFEVPRDADLSELATELGISNQAVSERLRRAQSRLVEKHVASN